MISTHLLINSSTPSQLWTISTAAPSGCSCEEPLDGKTAFTKFCAVSATLFLASFLLTVPGCSQSSSGNQTPQAPSIGALTPASGSIGAPVTITGANFGAAQGTSTVTFNGTTATVTSWSPTSIAAPVPTGASTGNVIVTVGGLASNGMPFTVSTSPTITSLSPTSGAAGTAVTIAGTNFGASQGTSTITFNGTAATVTSWSATSIVVAVPPGATTGNVVVTVGGQSSNGVAFTVSATAPAITGLSPTNGAVGASVTITGTNFGATQGSSTITFNGTAATVTSWSATSIVVAVPPGATTGNVVVTVGGQSSNGVAFTVSATAPAITSLSPTNGAVGASVTITGTNFGATQGSSTVTFNGVTGAVTAWSPTSITATVPAGATTGNVVVKVNGQASNGVAFTVSANAPAITSLNPTSGAVGTSVTITGTNFGATNGSSTVKFNGTAATVTSWSATSIVVAVPAGATTGNVVVTVGGQSSNGVAFTVSASAPAITNLNPTSGAVGTSVTITGTNFGATQGSSTVTFNGTAAAVTSWSATSIIATVPTGATTGNVVVTVGGNSSNVVSFTVSTGSITVAVAPKHAEVAVTQTLSLAATTNDSAGVKWSATAGSFSSTTSLNGTPVTYTAPSNGGTYTITATSITDGAATATVGVHATDLAGVYTYHNDLARDGANTQEYALSTSNVNTTTFGKLFTCAVDGAVYAQPLWVANVAIGSGTHNVIVAATMRDSVYLFDADASPCVTYWSKTLIPSGETFGKYSDVNTEDIYPDIGILGTPVIDPSSMTLYVVTKTKDGSSTYHQRLHALKLSDGSETANSPVDITSSSVSVPGDCEGGSTVTFNAKTENQRPGLALVNGVVYISWASHGDNDPYHGWIVGYSTSNLALATVFNTSPNAAEGLSYCRAGIWMSGGAPAADSSNNLYVLTGNGIWDGSTALGDSALKLGTSSGLSLLDWFTPYNQMNLDGNDSDVGSGGAAVLVNNSGPHPQLLIGGGKQGVLYVLDRTNMGHNHTSDNNQIVQSLSLSGSSFSTPGFWNNTLYYFGTSTSGKAFSLNSATSTFNTSPASVTGSSFSWPGSTPSISSNGSTAGIVWTIDSHAYGTSDNGSAAAGPAILHAFDASNLANELWNSSSSGNTAGNAVKFTVPTVANGRVYIGTRGGDSTQGSGSPLGEIDVFGLKP